MKASSLLPPLAIFQTINAGGFFATCSKFKLVGVVEQLVLTAKCTAIDGSKLCSALPLSSCYKRVGDTLVPGSESR